VGTACPHYAQIALIFFIFFSREFTLLFLSKALTRRGTIEEGSTVTDFDEEEIRRHISLSTVLAPVC